MAITMRRATPDSLGEIVEAVALWQRPGAPVQLHPGDLGWHWRFGADTLADAVRVWTRDDRILAVGLLDDGDGLIRMALSPAVDDDASFAAALLPDLPGNVEARFGTALRGLLRSSGWPPDESWTPLTRDLTEPVEDHNLTVRVVDERLVEDRVAVQRAAFPNSTFTAERWHAMAAAPPYRRARCLVGYDDAGDAVATVTVWSAGEGRPGLLEPMGVHRDHRRRGHGRDITLAAAAALREMGSSSATVCTPTSNSGGVTAYVSAGFRKHPAVADFRRPH